MVINRKWIAVWGVFWSLVACGQGLINNGAMIVMTNGANIHVDGSTGHYTNRSNGTIVNNTSGGVVLVTGDWINNGSNKAFYNDGATVILKGTAQSIGGSAATAFYNLTLSGNGVKQLAVNTNTVGGQTTYSGILSVGTQTLDLNGYRLDVTNSSTGAITNGSGGYIQSETNTAINPSVVRWYMRTSSGSHIYPFGVSGSSIPFTFNVTSPMASASDYVDVSTRATSSTSNTPWAGTGNVAAVSHMYSPIIGADGSVPVVIDRWWEITSSSAVTANVTFSYRGIENTLSSPYNTGQLGAQHWNGTAWDAPVGSAAAVTSGTGAVTANGLNTFSPWVLSSLLAPLPVELTSFSANCIDEAVVVAWTTASETNNSTFTIERSEDATHYHALTSVQGAGTSFGSHQYHYIDHSTGANMLLYYRVLQTDQSGVTRVLSTISVNPCHDNHDEVRISNTPSGELTLVFLLHQNEPCTFSLYDLTGRLVREEQILINDKYAEAKIGTEGLSESYYMLLIRGASFQKTQKVYIKN